MQWLCQIKKQKTKQKRLLEIGPKLRYCDYLLIGVYDQLVMAGYNIWETNRKVTQLLITLYSQCMGSASMVPHQSALAETCWSWRKKKKKKIQVQHRNTLYSRLYVPYKMVRPGNANMVKAGFCSQVIFYKRNFSS